MALDLVEKQPGDTQDYDVDYSAYLDDLDDAGASIAVTVASGITLEASSLMDSTSAHAVANIVKGVAKLWFAGGTTNTVYKNTVALTTAGGRVREFDFNIKVKEL